MKYFNDMKNKVIEYSIVGIVTAGLAVGGLTGGSNPNEHTNKFDLYSQQLSASGHVIDKNQIDFTNYNLVSGTLSNVDDKRKNLERLQHHLVGINSGYQGDRQCFIIGEGSENCRNTAIIPTEEEKQIQKGLRQCFKEGDGIETCYDIAITPTEEEKQIQKGLRQCFKEGDGIETCYDIAITPTEEEKQIQKGLRRCLKEGDGIETCYDIAITPTEEEKQIQKDDR